MIEAVTFDFWDTLFVDDSDEPIRAERGLPPKPAAREALFVAAAATFGVPAADAREGLSLANARARRRWKVDHYTPTVPERLRFGYEALGLEPGPEFDGLVAGFEQMEVEIQPRPAPGAAAVLRALAGRYRLGIISDTIVTPGRGLRQILGDNGMLDALDFFVFSDEVGASKPAPAIFRAASARGRAPLPRMAHVGDRESNDVVGPLEAGMFGVLYVGVVDRREGPSRASAVCRRHDEMPAILERLSGGGAA